MEEKFMRVLIMFDMPTNTKEDRKNYSLFRKKLIEFGFIMLQYSVYMRICRGTSSANNYINKVALIIPKKGNIRALIITEKQFDNIRILIGKESQNEKANNPIELTLF